MSIATADAVRMLLVMVVAGQVLLVMAHHWPNADGHAGALTRRWKAIAKTSHGTQFNTPSFDIH